MKEAKAKKSTFQINRINPGTNAGFNLLFVLLAAVFSMIASAQVNAAKIQFCQGQEFFGNQITTISTNSTIFR